MFPLDTMEKLNREAGARHFQARSLPQWHRMESCMPIEAFRDVLLIANSKIRLGYRAKESFYDSNSHLPIDAPSHWHELPAIPCASEQDVPF